MTTTVPFFMEIHLQRMTFRKGLCQDSYFQPINNDEPTKYWCFKLSKRLELLSDWLIYLTILDMIGRSKMNERLPDMTSSEMLLDISVSPNKNRNEHNKHLFLIRMTICTFGMCRLSVNLSFIRP
jgi:hypothetical protein